MKLSISLPEEDLAFIDDYADRLGCPSRSSVLHRAVSLLRESEMESAYASAWEEWDSTVEAPLWEATAQDGATDAAR